ncbi:hypothetical protein ACET3X_001932 [Alternaria dauci]|uniref:Uncharacterized protein n=1 Tax=Alternaria dauci TaxID=48095 RepID=A0ABR3UZN8_9PLEO
MPSNASNSTTSNRDASPINHRTIPKSQMNYENDRDDIETFFTDRARKMIEYAERDKNLESKEEADNFFKRIRGFTETHNHWMEKRNTLVEQESEDLKKELMEEFEQLVHIAEGNGVVFSREKDNFVV